MVNGGADGIGYERSVLSESWGEGFEGYDETDKDRMWICYPQECGDRRGDLTLFTLV